MPLPILRRSRKLTSDVLAERAVKVAVNPRLLDTFPDGERKQLAPVIKAIQAGASGSNSSVRGMQNARALAASTIAQRAHQNLAASVGLTPSDIQLALQQQGLDWVQPFAPGAPLTPFFGYNRRPRNYDYNVGRNVTTETRPDRIPFATLLQLYKSYDVAQICTRHAINDLRSMRIRFEPIDGYEGKNPSKDLAAAKAFWKRPDGVYSFKNWLAKHAMDVWRYDAGTLYKMRDRAGNLKSLKVIQGSTIAPMLDYFGDRPTGEAPAYEQFIEGVPWDWLRAEDLVYEPMWPEPESPYGTPPLETVLVNANTDVRLQMYFLQFFTAGNVPEAFAIAPEDMSDPDGLAELQETWRDWTYGDQSERWGLRWLPAGTEIEPYKPQEFDPDIAEYVMRRTVSAYMMVPNDMGFTADVNKASGSTQVDVQFRIGTSPNVAYYEDIIDSITQEDLGLPVQIRFDTGREKEDRLMEAQAHQIYVSMGAESPSEVREKVLGHPINPEEKVPLFFDSLRLGPVPISYLLAIAGDVDPLTGMPKPGSVEPREFVVPGMMAPDPPVGTPQAGGQHALAPPPPPAPKAAADPKAPARKGDQAEGEDEDELSPTSPHPDEAPGYGTASSGSTGQGSAAKSEDDDLRKWRSNARKAVARGKSPRQFTDSAIRPAVYARVWKSLDGATTRADVDAAFAKAAPVPAQWEDFHHHIDTILDHYAPEIQSAMAQVLSDDTIDAVLHEVAKTAKAALPPNQAAAAGVAPPPVNPGTAAAVGVAAGGVTVAAAGAAVATGAVAGAVGGAASVAAVWAILNTAARKFGPLRSVLTALYGDAYIQGAHEGAVTSDGAMPPWTSALNIPSGYWTNWTPGVGESASQMAGGSLATLLADRDIWIKEMTTTQVDRIGNLVAEAIDGGPVDIAELAAEIDQITNDAKRAWLIAETEYSRARTEGARASYALNNVPEIAWISQPGACALCLANQAVSPIERGHPWPSGSVPVHPRCLPASTRIVVPGNELNRLALDPAVARVVGLGDGGSFAATAVAAAERDFGRRDIRAVSERDYVGEVVTIVTALGHKLTATPNHPVATPNGWVPISELAKGSYVLSSTAPEWVADAVDPYVDHIPPTIQEISQSFSVALGPMPTAPEDFHGDGAGSDVHVVLADSRLVANGQAPTSEEPGELPFGWADIPLPGFDTNGATLQELDRLWNATDSGVGAGSQEFAAFRARLRHALDHRFTAPSGFNPGIEEEPPNRSAADTEGFCERLLAFTSEITTDEVVSIRSDPFSDHVYNLDTVGGWYIGNGIVTHNCRCVEAPVIHVGGQRIMPGKGLE